MGNGVGTKGVNVGNGVKVGKSNPNKGVGVASVPWVGRTTGLGTGLAELRGRNTAIKIEQRQQNRINTETESRIRVT